MKLRNQSCQLILGHYSVLSSGICINPCLLSVSCWGMLISEVYTSFTYIGERWAWALLFIFLKAYMLLYIHPQKQRHRKIRA